MKLSLIMYCPSYAYSLLSVMLVAASLLTCDNMASDGMHHQSTFKRHMHAVRAKSCSLHHQARSVPVYLLSIQQCVLQVQSPLPLLSPLILATVLPYTGLLLS